MRSRKAEILVIFSEEFRRQTARLGYRAFTLLVPGVLLVALIVVPVVRNATDSGAAREDKIGYFDPDAVLQDLVGSPTVVRFQTRQAGLSALNSDQVKALFVMDPSYMETGRVEWYRRGGSLFAGEEHGELFKRRIATSLVSGRVEPAVLVRVNAPAEYDRYRVDDHGIPQPDTKTGAEEAAEFFVPYIFALLLMVSIFTGSGYLLQSVSEEKETRMIEMMVTSVSPFSIMAGKVLALGAAGLVQVAVWFASAMLIGPRIMSQIPDAGDLPLTASLLVPVLLFFVAGYFLFAVVMAGLGAATSSMREATQYSTIITLPNVIPVWGSALIIDSPNGGFARVLSFVPFTAPTTVMLRLGAGDVPAWEIAASLAVTVLAGAVLLWASARVFRAGLLLYGQRMSPRAIWRAVRQAG